MTAGSGEALRQQLHETLLNRIDGDYFERCGMNAAHLVDEFVFDIWPLIEAELAAARVATATEIAEAIEAEPNSHRVHFTDEDGNNDYVDQAHGSKHYAALVRQIAVGGSVPAPKGDRNG